MFLRSYVNVLKEVAEAGGGKLRIDKLGNGTSSTPRKRWSLGRVRTFFSFLSLRCSYSTPPLQLLISSL